MQSQEHKVPRTAASYQHRAPVDINLAVAMAIASVGIPLHPFVQRGGKLIPASPHGRADATTNPAQIENWARRDAVLFAAPTGPESGLWAGDFDLPHGPAWLSEQMQRRAIEQPADITDVWSISKSGGVHAYFRFGRGCPARSRASDIARDVDTRATGGSIMLPGNPGYDLADIDALIAGRIVRLKASPEFIADRLLSVPAAPTWFTCFASFGAPERAVIAASPDMRDEIRQAAPEDWHAIVERHRAAQRRVLEARLSRAPEDAEGMRAQALHDLRDAARSYAGLTDGRRNELFTWAAKLARYVVHNVVTEGELRSALRDAATANGAIGAHGARWADGCITRALRLGENDPLPPLARRFRTSGRAAA